ncbi:MAG TPA: hypothetical protein PKM59_11670 [Thermodesulfobacteriota bacterium]|nr:hypothetical protein [Thermodesulfobacteriota bacterium]HNU70392.1 hypothetical protein [Thermodesulfobacteriota bacterium]
MWAHQVIDDIEKQKRNLPRNFLDNKFPPYLRKLVNADDKIRNAQQFYFGEHKTFCVFPEGERFSPELMRYARPPFKLCWIEFIDGADHKGALLVEEITDGLLFILSFNDFNDYDDEWKWEMSPVGSLCAYNGALADYREHLEQIDGFMPDDDPSDANVCQVLLINPLEADIRQRISLRKAADSANYDTSVLCQALILLNCKNITTEKVNPPLHVNKKRRKNGRSELFSYHALKVRIPGTKEEIPLKNIVNPESHNRIHLRRGHFKVYTHDAPLMGKHIGLYWWSPHLCGRNSKGVVVKDYQVKVRKNDEE